MASTGDGMTKYEEIRERVKSNMKESRFIHSEGVAEMASYLSKRFLDDSESGRVAGIFHDYCRYMGNDELLSFCSSLNDIVPEEREKPMLLHGAAAGLVFRKLYPEYGNEYYLAMRHHTLGSIDMGVLGACVYIADYAEKGRKHITDKDREEILSEKTLEAMVLNILGREKKYRESLNENMAGVSKALMEYLEKGGVFTI
ncbi:MAG: HD domain-containing protein [Sphaerochaetaceae bacterium]|nr:HD domain-containing protein [Sphaerochaetaceae bacterium]